MQQRLGVVRHANLARILNRILVKPCTRCPVLNVDQRTGESGDEPGLTLAALHTLDAGVVFGMNAIVAQTRPLALKVGDPVEISLNF